MLEAYCKYCEQDVQRVNKKFSWAWLCAWIFLSFGTLFWVYPLYRFCIQPTRCHKCDAIIVGWDLKPLYNKNGNRKEG